MPRRRRRPAKKHVELLNRARPFYEEMLRVQGGGCAICGRPPSDKRKLDIDHDHQRMVVRGLLCPRDNILLGNSTDPLWHRAVADYLENPPALWLEELLRGQTSGILHAPKKEEA